MARSTIHDKEAVREGSTVYFTNFLRTHFLQNACALVAENGGNCIFILLFRLSVKTFTNATATSKENTVNRHEIFGIPIMEPSKLRSNLNVSIISKEEHRHVY